MYRIEAKKSRWLLRQIEIDMNFKIIQIIKVRLGSASVRFASEYFSYKK